MPMTELRDNQTEIWHFRLRALAVGALVLVAFFLVLARLVFLQVLRHEDLAAQAESNRTAVLPIVPGRGLILDRNGVVLATNYSAYTLEITPARVAADPHAPDGPGGGALCGAALPLSRRGYPGAAVSQLPAGRCGQPCHRIHRPHQPEREGPHPGFG